MGMDKCRGRGREGIMERESECCKGWSGKDWEILSKGKITVTHTKRGLHFLLSLLFSKNPLLYLVFHLMYSNINIMVGGCRFNILQMLILQLLVFSYFLLKHFSRALKYDGENFKQIMFLS